MGVYVIIAAIILAISFIGFIVYSAKGGNLLIGLLITATIWMALGAVYNVINLGAEQSIWNSIMADVETVFQKGPANYGGTIAIIIFASWFGRVLVDTGIAKALIRKVVELAGSQQLVTILLVGIVSALMFTSIFGPGSVIAMGTIILPILFAMGVNKKMAVGTFIMSVAAGMYVNGGYTAQFSGHDLFKPIWQLNGFESKFTLFGWSAFGIHLLIMIIFILVNYFLGKGKVRSWALEGDQASTTGGLEPAKVSSLTFIVPFIPILITLITIIAGLFTKNTLVGIPVNVGFLIGIFVGLLATNNLRNYRQAVKSIQETLFNGITDVALLIGMLLILNMFSTSASLVAPIINRVLGNSMNWMTTSSGMWIIVIAFIVLSPLALFRGPFMIWGSGIALATVLYAVLGGEAGVGSQGIAGAYPILLALFFVQPVGMVANTCPTQSWNMWALSYSKYEAKEFIKSNFVWSWAITAINILLAFLLFGRM